MSKGTSTIESFMMVNGKAGDHFYTHKSDGNLTANASYYKRKIKTERLILVKPNATDIKAETVTRVTILQ